MTYSAKILSTLLLLAGLSSVSALAASFQTKGVDEKPWLKILGSVGITPGNSAASQVEVAGSNADEALLKRAAGRILILEGDSPAARALGIVPQGEKISIRQIRDVHAPNMQIIWEQPLQSNKVTLPDSFQVYATERWQNAPVLAGRRAGNGAVLWMATAPGATGIERYPYLLHALVDLGLDLPLKATTLWAFFDSSYRIRADPDYLARRWRRAGVGVLHVAAWHNMEADLGRDTYLANLIEACHRNAILVYAWLELPHVSEKFWDDHPQWREKTAAGQDAQLDWRKLMNLQNSECRTAVEKNVGELLARFDWDGVNVAELYFESLEGASNPARFTPMNADVRAAFQKQEGFDPKTLFEPGAAVNPAGLRKFLDYRAALASGLQAEWLDVIDRTRRAKPYLDIVLTHIDDRFEPGIRDALGADVARSLPLIQSRKSTLLVEDPATLWNLGPERYGKLAQQYRALTSDDGIAVDINIVERYQDVYPTKKQTGVELMELVHEAAVSFFRVALYFENSLEKQDLALLPAAAVTATVTSGRADALTLRAMDPTRMAWQGAAEMDGKLWPVQDAHTVLVPPGTHTFEASAQQPGVVISDFNGQIKTALGALNRAELSYTSKSRAVAILGSPVSAVVLDGAPYLQVKPGEPLRTVMLPAGDHAVTFYR